jgi:histidinol-phosphate/aromatic aminotransferase/cobyric acid decarboxylase-like protein
VPDPRRLYDALLRRGLLVRPFADAIRITVRDATDDDRLIEAITASSH